MGHAAVVASLLEHGADIELEFDVRIPWFIECLSINR